MARVIITFQKQPSSVSVWKFGIKWSAKDERIVPNVMKLTRYHRRPSRWEIETQSGSIVTIETSMVEAVDLIKTDPKEQFISGGDYYHSETRISLPPVRRSRRS